MSSTKPFRMTVIVSLMLHLTMIASVLMTMSGQLELTLANPVQKHTQILVLASPSQQPEVQPEDVGQLPATARATPPVGDVLGDGCRNPERRACG